MYLDNFFPNEVNFFFYDDNCTERKGKTVKKTFFLIPILNFIENKKYIMPRKGTLRGGKGNLVPNTFLGVFDILFKQ